MDDEVSQLKRKLDDAHAKRMNVYQQSNDAKMRKRADDDAAAAQTAYNQALQKKAPNSGAAGDLLRKFMSGSK